MQLVELRLRPGQCAPPLGCRVVQTTNLLRVTARLTFRRVEKIPYQKDSIPPRYGVGNLNPRRRRGQKWPEDEIPEDVDISLQEPLSTPNVGEIPYHPCPCRYDTGIASTPAGGMESQGWWYCVYNGGRYGISGMVISLECHEKIPPPLRGTWAEIEGGLFLLSFWSSKSPFPP